MGGPTKASSSRLETKRGVKESCSVREPPLIAPVGVHHKNSPYSELYSGTGTTPDERDLFAVRRPSGAVVLLVRPTASPEDGSAADKEFWAWSVRPTAAVRVYYRDARIFVRFGAARRRMRSCRSAWARRSGRGSRSQAGHRQGQAEQVSRDKSPLSHHNLPLFTECVLQVGPVLRPPLLFRLLRQFVCPLPINVRHTHCELGQRVFGDGQDEPRLWRTYWTHSPWPPKLRGRVNFAQPPFLHSSASRGGPHRCSLPGMLTVAGFPAGMTNVLYSSTSSGAVVLRAVDAPPELLERLPRPEDLRPAAAVLRRVERAALDDVEGVAGW